MTQCIAIPLFRWFTRSKNLKEWKTQLSFHKKVGSQQPYCHIVYESRIEAVLKGWQFCVRRDAVFLLFLFWHRYMSPWKWLASHAFYLTLAGLLFLQIIRTKLQDSPTIDFNEVLQTLSKNCENCKLNPSRFSYPEWWCIHAIRHMWLLENREL